MIDTQSLKQMVQEWNLPEDLSSITETELLREIEPPTPQHNYKRSKLNTIQDVKKLMKIPQVQRPKNWYLSIKDFDNNLFARINFKKSLGFDYSQDMKVMKQLRRIRGSRRKMFRR